MAILQIVYYPDPPLTDKAEPVAKFDAELAELARDMFATMEAYEGVGLAAPQVGHSKRLFVAREPDGIELIAVNPELSMFEGEELGQEGCLSMPEVYGDVPRATSLVLKAQDLMGRQFEIEAKEFLARIIQHEFDHLEGILFPQRLDVFTRQRVMQEWDEVRDRLLSSSPQAPRGHATE